MKEMWFSAILVLILFYAFLILPQQLSSRQRKKQLNRLTAGDQVATYGGLIGQVVSTDADHFVLEIAPGVAVKVLASGISHKIQAKEVATG